MASPMASPKASPKASAVRRAAIAAATVAKRWPRRVLGGEWCLARKSAPRRARHAVGEEHGETAQTHGALPSAGQPNLAGGDRDRRRIWGVIWGHGSREKRTPDRTPYKRYSRVGFRLVCSPILAEIAGFSAGSGLVAAHQASWSTPLSALTSPPRRLPWLLETPKHVLQSSPTSGGRGAALEQK